MEKGNFGQHSGNSRASYKFISPVTGSDQNLDNSEEEKFDSPAQNSKAYMAGMENAVGGLKQSKSQTATFGPGGTDANPEIYAGIVSAAKMDDEFLSPVDGSDQNLANSEEATNDSMLMQEDGYGMSAAKMSALKGRYMHHKK